MSRHVMAAKPYETADVESLASEDSSDEAPKSKKLLCWVLPAVLLLSLAGLGVVYLTRGSTPSQDDSREPEKNPRAAAADRKELEVDALDLDCYKKGMFYADPIKLPGSARTDEANHTACQARCAATSGCSHFTFWPDGGCLLTGVVSSLKASPEELSGSVVGPKVCTFEAVTTLPPVDWSIDVPPPVVPDANAVTVYDSFIPTVDPAIVNKSAGVNGTACSAYPECAALQMTGNCCPNDEGVALGCCSPGVLEVAVALQDGTVIS
eukprot:TRINITY_DN25247_c0_g1_i1.p1 TRINITY_DN25247_c0_g1~~TRINITY_DN25247_c0_g1_i1.p1  ORF type:complete len:266 (-),score=56.18 TRINITY_DN25247_c0_g1_i1:190-987(-)